MSGYDFIFIYLFNTLQINWVCYLYIYGQKKTSTSRFKAVCTFSYGSFIWVSEIYFVNTTDNQTSLSHMIKYKSNHSFFQERDGQNIW